MSLQEKVKNISLRAESLIEQISTEEGTKNALIMPLIGALGYDVFDPSDVTPEFAADVGIKKGEKVDYAIKHDNKPSILVECKAVGSSLSVEKASQLYRYFSVTDARFAILTDGIEYLFYSDIDSPNKMDPIPFFEFNLLRYDNHHIEDLAKFSKEKFSLEDILAAANKLKYLKGFKSALVKEAATPSDNFVKLLLADFHSGRLTQQVIDEFRPTAQQALRQYVNEQINERLRSAMAPAPKPEVISESETNSDSAPRNEGEDDNGIVTTVDEIEGYHIVRAILREIVDVSRIVMRDTKSYCGILLDDNNRRPICRLHFNYSQKYIGLFDKERTETRHPINSLDDIYKFADVLHETVHYY